MDAPEKFADWMSGHVANDRRHGRTVYRYHPRSDAHSRRLCELVLSDLLAACEPLARHVASGEVVGGTNVPHLFPSGRAKTLDLAIGTPINSGPRPLVPVGPACAPIQQLRIALEAKQCMTEHSKAKPRLFDGLSSSHEIVHSGAPEAIACGIVVVNIASRYASPTRQIAGDLLVYTGHRQPHAARAIIEHLRGLQRRSGSRDVGFDAFSSIVIDCDNTSECTLHTAPPAPQFGDLDHYGSLISGISQAYAERFS